MADFIKTQNSFSHGAIAPEFYTRSDINGLSELENMDVLSGGGLSRRNGLRRIDSLRGGAARLIAFSVSDLEQYIIALTDYHMYIYLNDVLYQDLITPWSYSDALNLQYAQRFGTMIFVHSDYRPRVLQKSGNVFEISNFIFAQNDANLDVYMPFVRFEDTQNIRITVTEHEYGNNYATFTSNLAIWSERIVNTRIILQDKQWTIVKYIDSKTVVAYVNGGYTLPTSPISDWRESAFSDFRGWPRCITFHQNRLVFAGTRAWPGGIWLSRVGAHTNFDTGSGLDDEAIFVSLLSQQRQQIYTVVSSQNLQILTSSGEWAISSKPLTPTNVNIRQHTSVGSYSSRCLAPQRIEDATIFVATSGNDIRELVLDDLGENYSANDLCALSKHLLSNPVDIAYNKHTRQLFVVCQDGNMAVLNIHTALGISAWAKYTTCGEFMSIAVSEDKTYVVVYRDNTYYLERFDCTVFRDSNEYDFSFVASGVPLIASNHNLRHIKLRKIVSRVYDTKSLTVNGISIRFPNDIYSPGAVGYSGDVSINTLGSVSDCSVPIWTISGTSPYPATVLSITLHGWYTA